MKIFFDQRPPLIGQKIYFAEKPRLLGLAAINGAVTVFCKWVVSFDRSCIKLI